MYLLALLLALLVEDVLIGYNFVTVVTSQNSIDKFVNEITVVNDTHAVSA